MKKSCIMVLALAIMMSCLSACQKAGAPFEPERETLLPPQHANPDPAVSDNRKALSQFITDRLSGPYGVYTNLIDTDQSQEMATGHEVLSESASLMMRSLVLNRQKEAFAKEWARAREIFDSTSGFSYRYSPKQHKKYPLNAAVDDLRFIRALYEAGAVFNDPSFTSEADQLGKRFYTYNVKNGQMYDFYDETYKTTNKFVTLCYIDLKTLGQLPVSPEARASFLTQMREVIKNGYISDLFPFYQTRYNYEMKEYASEDINTVESLLTILSLAEVNEQEDSSIRYMKEHVKAGTLYGKYSIEGKPLNDTQSTAIYAITAMIGTVLKDEELYHDSLQRMSAFQVKDAGNSMYGGFGDTGTMQAYSFDNLMALLAYSY